MTLFEELQARGLIAQMTNPEEIEKSINSGNTTFYIGFDATADSLHVGHFLQLVVIGHMQKAGNKPILLLGTGTTMVGDPSGKTDMRKMLTEEAIDHNAECFRRQMERFVDFGDDKAIVRKNGDWLKQLNYIEMLRDIGVCFSVNKMLSAECFKSRYANGLSFIEFNYMIMQSYDFLHLNRSENCTMQLGGDDQWSNILGGVDLVRRKEQKEVYGMTFTLLTTKEGKKMGKTENGAVWLDPEKTTPFEFFQYWRNIADADVINCMKMLTYIPLDEIKAMESWEGAQLNKAKEILAHELTKMVHGEEAANKSLEAATALFKTGADSANMPTATISNESFVDGEILLADLMVQTAIAPSKSEIRRLIQQGGVSVDEVKIDDFNHKINLSQFDGGHIVVKKGKKSFTKIILG